jgi:SAM-dependent methyltransferase
LKKYFVQEVISSKYIAEELKFKLLGYQNSNALIAYKKSICSSGYEPGTFRLSEIGVNSTFINNSQPFEDWVKSAIEAELLTLKNNYNILIKKCSFKDLIQQSIQILESKTNGGYDLKHEIWYQEYSDVFRRIILFCSGNDPDIELELFPNLTIQREKFIFAVLNWIEINKKVNLRKWLHLSVAAGLIGINEKSPHTAASEIEKNFAIPLDSPNEDWNLSISRVGNSVYKLSNSVCRIDSSEWLFQYLNFSKGIMIRILSFPDDYIETIFLLKFYQELLKTYKNVEIHCVPRMIRCGNDASYNDFYRFLKRFKYLKDCKRFFLHNNGPKLGTVNITKLHLSVLNLIEECDFIDARGARNYEMMQGINKDTFFGFMVCREFSESTTGFFAKDTPFIYIKQSAGERSFQGFRERSKRIINGKYFCRITAADNKNKWEGGHLAQYEKWSDLERKRYKYNQKFYSKGATEFHQKYGDLLEREVKKYLNKISGRILVLGCGSGKEVGFLFDNKNDAIGIDFSVEAILIARQRYPHIWDRFFVDDFYNTINFGNGEFDAIVANAVFVHLLKRDDLPLLMKQVHTRLKKNGQFFIRLLQKDGFDEEYDSELFKTRRWFVYYSDEEIQSFSKDIGFEIIMNQKTPHVQYESVYWLSYLLLKV